MAKTKGGKLAAVPEPEETEEASAYGVENREPNELHEAFSAWVQEEIGEKVSPRAAQLSWSMRNAFRKSDAYTPFRTAKEQRAADKEAEDAEDTPKPAKTKTAKAAKVVKEADETAETPPAKAAAKPARARGKAAKATAPAAPF